jgi:hypothetical protein
VPATVLDHARLYLSLGFAVLPLHFPFVRGSGRVCSCMREECHQPAKHPFGRLVRNGLKDASKDPAIVEHWFTRTGFNIGIATGAASGIVVLDIDPRHGGDESLARLETEKGKLPATWRFLTGGGGEHIVFRHPSRNVPNNAGALGPGIDVRGDGGYIVAPPSVHMSGRPYAISVDHHPDDVPLADVPEPLLPMLCPPASNGHATRSSPASPEEWRRRIAADIAEGERNVAIAKVAGLLLGRRVDPHAVLDLMLAYNATHCRPPLPDQEVVVTVASIARREYVGRGARRKKRGRHG